MHAPRLLSLLLQLSARSAVLTKLAPAVAVTDGVEAGRQVEQVVGTAQQDHVGIQVDQPAEVGWGGKFSRCSVGNGQQRPQVDVTTWSVKSVPLRPQRTFEGQQRTGTVCALCSPGSTAWPMGMP